MGVVNFYPSLSLLPVVHNFIGYLFIYFYIAELLAAHPKDFVYFEYYYVFADLIRFVSFV